MCLGSPPRQIRRCCSADERWRTRIDEPCGGRRAARVAAEACRGWRCPVSPRMMRAVAGRLPAEEKVRRDSAVVADRGRGLTWSTIAERHNLSERHCREIWSEGRGLRLHAEDPLEALADLLAQLDAGIEDLALLAETARNESVKLGALKARMGATSEKFELLRACGLLPRDLRVFRFEVEVQQVAAMVLATFDSEGVPVEDTSAVVTALRSTGAESNGDVAAAEASAEPPT